MNYTKIKKCDISNGSGVRVSLYVSGCTHHCPNCFNPETWDFNAGKPYDKAVEEEIMNALRPSYIKGLSLLGGEPFEPENRPALIALSRRVKDTFPEKTIWCYSGYDYEKELLAGHVGDFSTTEELLSLIDVLVDGEFEEAHRVTDLRFRGSTNQRIIDVPKSLATDDVILWDDGLDPKNE